jgi:S-methylmethionine-dependent homocysteine/selenocysteine methylase
LSSEEAEALLRKSVEIACEAREIYHERCTKDSWDFMENGTSSSRRPILVAASVGSYGAYLADGSEYRFVQTSTTPWTNFFEPVWDWFEPSNSHFQPFFEMQF